MFKEYSRHLQPLSQMTDSKLILFVNFLVTTRIGCCCCRCLGLELCDCDSFGDAFFLHNSQLFFLEFVNAFELADKG